ncbi:MAG: hypothetical protein Kow0045_16610 [Albidovulum sp.]
MRAGLMRTTFAALACALAAACQGPISPSAAVTRSLSLGAGDISVAGPSGYCVDRRASRETGSGAFVLFGSCAALAGSPLAGQPEKPALLTASVAPALSGEGLETRLDELAAFFRSDAGRAALSRDGRAGSVTIAAMERARGVLYIRLVDRSAAAQKVEPGYWRAAFAMRGRLVTLSAMSLADRPVADRDLRRTLDRFIARIRRDNGGAA